MSARDLHSTQMVAVHCIASGDVSWWNLNFDHNFSDRLRGIIQLINAMFIAAMLDFDKKQRCGRRPVMVAKP